MSPTKILGWLLLIIGILMISYFLFASYNIFTGKSRPPEIFKIEGLDPSVTLTSPSFSLEEGIPQEQIESLIEEQLRTVLPLGYLSGLLNLISWSILVGIFVFAGAHIAGLGINLIKE